jgi:hypothetical protein
LSDVVALFEAELAAGDVEHVCEQHPLQLSDFVASFEQVAAGDVEQSLLQLSDIVASFEQHVATGSAEHV